MCLLTVTCWWSTLPFPRIIRSCSGRFWLVWTSPQRLICSVDTILFVIAVTGSNGKSTTSVLIHHLLQQSWQTESCWSWLGGNIGISLLKKLQDIRAEDCVAGAEQLSAGASETKAISSENSRDHEFYTQSFGLAWIRR